MKRNSAQYSTFLHARFSIIAALISVIFGVHSYCFIFHISFKEIAFCLGVTPLLISKFFVIHFISAKTIERILDYYSDNPINRVPYKSSPRDKDSKISRLHDYYEASIPYHLIFMLCILTGFPLIKISNIPEFLQTFVLPVVLAHLTVFLMNVIFFKRKNLPLKFYRDITLIAAVYWSLCGSIYCSLNLTPHYPMLDPDRGAIALGIMGIPLIGVLSLLISRFTPKAFQAPGQRKAFAITTILAGFIIFSGPHQFNSLMNFSYTGGGKKIEITTGNKSIPASYIVGKADYFIAWPEGAPEPLKYLGKDTEFRPFKNSEKKSPEFDTKG